MANATLPSPAVDTDARVSFIDQPTRALAAALAAELQDTRQEIGLQPAPFAKFTRHMIRVVHQHNPAWYRKLCERRAARRQRRRHFQTAIKRQDVLIGLRQLALGYRGRLADDLLWIIDWQRAEDAAAAASAPSDYSTTDIGAEIAGGAPSPTASAAEPEEIDLSAGQAADPQLTVEQVQAASPPYQDSLAGAAS